MVFPPNKVVGRRRVGRREPMLDILQLITCRVDLRARKIDGIIRTTDASARSLLLGSGEEKLRTTGE
jgi:hypothetical protein